MKTLNNKNFDVIFPFNNQKTSKPLREKSGRNHKNRHAGIFHPNRKSILLHAFGQRFQLRLQAIDSSDFMANQYDLINKKKISATNKNNSNFFNNSIDSDNCCLYVGHVNQHLDSKAFINLCHVGNLVSVFFFFQFSKFST